MDPQLLRVIDKTTSPRISSAISIIMLRAMGSRIMFSVLATLVLVLLTSTLTSATPVARWALDEYDQQDNSNMLRTLPSKRSFNTGRHGIVKCNPIKADKTGGPVLEIDTRGSRARQIQRPVKQEYVYSVCLPEDKYQQCQATCSASRSDAKVSSCPPTLFTIENKAKPSARQNIIIP